MIFFGKGKEKIRGVEWDWENFNSTKDYPVPLNMLDWIIGQDKALQECYLCLDEWVHKLKYLKEEKWFDLWKDPESHKPKVAKMIPSGPFLFLLGDAGTGKSLIGRALSQFLDNLYRRHNVKLYDVLAWKNKKLPSEPKISVHDAGKGRLIQIKEKLKEMKRKWLMKWGFRLLQGTMIGFGLTILGIVIGFILYNWFANAGMYAGFSPDELPIPTQEYFRGDVLKYLMFQFMGYAQMLYLGIGALSMGAMLFIFKNLLGRGLGGITKGVGGAESTDAPKLIIDNSSEEAPFIDATGHGSAQLFGSIAWDPYQTGGMGTPEHQRVSAGDVHRANLGILYIDELKNLKQQEAVTLLTVLEDGQLPIALRSVTHGGDTAAMSVSTEPVPALTFLVGAGNYDSIPMIHPALMDRIYGYGKVVSMNNDMPNTVENRRKFVQFIAQEAKRFRLPPFGKYACIEIIKEARRRSGKRSTLTCRFRPMISIIKTSAILAMNEGGSIVLPEHVREAIDEHCKTVQRQLLEQRINVRRMFVEINPKAEPQFGRIYGLGAHQFGDDFIGMVLGVNGVMQKREKPATEEYFKVTGIKAKDPIWIIDSARKVKSVIMQKYGIDFNDYNVHIDFAQQHTVDGPSAGVTMTLLLTSFLTKRPIRQDVAVTGEINLSIDEKIQITAVGGVDAKIKAAELRGFKKVVIPMSNYNHSINPSDYKIKVVGAETLEDYISEVLA